jgi:hypothetical protein
MSWSPSGLQMAVDQRQSKSRLWLSGISFALLAVAWSVEPFLFPDERFTLWRIVKIATMAIAFVLVEYSRDKSTSK